MKKALLFGLIVLLSLTAFAARAEAVPADYRAVPIASVIPDSSMWGVSSNTFTEGHKGEFQSCMIGTKEGLRASSVHIDTYPMTGYFAFGTTMKSTEGKTWKGLSKATYILDASETRSDDELKQCFATLSTDMKGCLGEPASASKAVAEWDVDGVNVKIGIGKAENYTGSDVRTVMVVVTGKPSSKRKDERKDGNTKTSNGEKRTEYNLTLLLKAFDYDLSWETLSKSSDSLALFAAMLARDGEDVLSDYKFKAGNVKDVYAATYLGQPSVIFYVNSSLLLVCVSGYLYQAGNIEYINVTWGWQEMPEYMKYMEQKGFFMDARNVDKSKFLDDVRADLGSLGIVTEDVLLANADERELFRQAKSVYPTDTGWFCYNTPEYAGFINAKGEGLGAYNYIEGIASAFDDAGLSVTYRGPMESFPGGSSPLGFPAKDADGHHQGVYSIIDTEGHPVLMVDNGRISISTDLGVALIERNNGIKQLYDLRGRAFIDMEGQYDDISCDGLGECIRIAVYDPASEGKLLWGVADRDGRQIIEPKYDSIWSVNNGYTIAVLDGKYGVLDEHGNVVIPFTWDYATSFDGKVGIVRKQDTDYLVDVQGMILHEFKGEHIYAHGEGYYEGYDPESGLSRVIDADGNEILSRKWSRITPIDVDSALVAAPNGDGVEMYGIIDLRTGEFIVPLKYSDLILNRKSGLHRFKQLDAMGYLNEDYEVVIPPQYEDETVFTDGIAAVKDASGWHFIDTSGKTVGP